MTHRLASVFSNVVHNPVTFPIDFFLTGNFLSRQKNLTQKLRIFRFIQGRNMVFGYYQNMGGSHRGNIPERKDCLTLPDNIRRYFLSGNTAK